MEDPRYEDDHLTSGAPDATSQSADDTTQLPKNAFHERIGTTNDAFEQDFLRSLDPDENPYIGDQLEDDSLNVAAEKDYQA